MFTFLAIPQSFPNPPHRPLSPGRDWIKARRGAWRPMLSNPRENQLLRTMLAKDRLRGIGQDLAAQHDVFVLCILGPVMANAVDAWHEEHRGGNFPRENLRIVSRGARHRHRAARRAMIRSAPQFILKAMRHQDRIDLPDAFENDFAGTRLIGLGDQFIQRVFKTLELRDLDVADLKQHLSAARHDAGLAWLEADCACGPDASRAGDFGKSRSDRAAQRDERDAGVPTYRHPSRPCVVLLAGEGDAILPDADDARDDPKMQAGLVEIIALLDMGFQIAHVIFRRDRLSLLRR